LPFSISHHGCVHQAALPSRVHPSRAALTQTPASIYTDTHTHTHTHLAEGLYGISVAMKAGVMQGSEVHLQVIVCAALFIRQFAT
jgi:hypothetical protein